MRCWARSGGPRSVAREPRRPPLRRDEGEVVARGRRVGRRPSARAAAIQREPRWGRRAGDRVGKLAGQAGEEAGDEHGHPAQRLRRADEQRRESRDVIRVARFRIADRRL